MTNLTLKSTVAAIALTAGAAWADTDMDVDSDAKIDSDVVQSTETLGEKLEKDAETAANEIKDTADETVAAGENALDEVSEDTAEAEDGADTDEIAGAESEAGEDSNIPAIDQAEVDTDKGADEDTVTAANPAADSVMSSESTIANADAFAGMTVADLVGMEVETASGEDVGEIDYIFKAGGEVKAIVGVGGFLGLGEHDVAVPLSELSLSDEEDELTLANWTEAELEAQPDVDEGEIEALDDDMRIGEAL